MGRFSDKIKKAQSQTFIQTKVTDRFTSLINNLVEYISDLEENNVAINSDMFDRLVRSKIDELNIQWVVFVVFVNGPPPVYEAGSR